MNKILTGALISMLFTASTTAQETLTLQSAIQTALEKNIDVIRSKNNTQIQDANVTKAYGNFLPSVNASANMGRSATYYPATFFSPAGISSNNSVGASVNASLTIFDGFRNTSSFSRASSSSEAAALDYSRQKQNTVLAVQRAYLTVLRNQSLLQVAQENLKRSQQQLSRIEESNKVGAVAKADVYRQQVQTSNDELLMIDAQSNYDNSKQELLYVLSLDVTKDYDINDVTVLQQIEQLDFDSLQQEYADYNQLVQEALVSRPDYQSSLLSKQMFENDLTIARSAHYPSLNLGAGYGYNGTDFSTLTDTKTWNWRLSLSFPIFSGFQTSTQVQTSELNLELAEHTVEQAKRGVAKEVKSALLSLESTHKKYEVSLKSVKSAEEDRRIAEERYNLGANTLLDLQVATANYTQAISNKVSSSYDFVYAKLQFRIAVGREKY